ncbi:hypothetical protein Syun_022826 [Stephania yunnanensis]|uniref:Uncharacterized protein n=1 Tax=Stephania yunnanensis TaxID=152371 RepID=A0AAP0I332_9MAGN
MKIADDSRNSVKESRPGRSNGCSEEFGAQGWKCGRRFACTNQWGKIVERGMIFTALAASAESELYEMGTHRMTTRSHGSSGTRFEAFPTRMRSVLSAEARWRPNKWQWRSGPAVDAEAGEATTADLGTREVARRIRGDGGGTLADRPGNGALAAPQACKDYAELIFVTLETNQQQTSLSRYIRKTHRRKKRPPLLIIVLSNVAAYNRQPQSTCPSSADCELLATNASLLRPNGLHSDGEKELNLGLLCNNLEKQSLFLLDALIKFEILRYSNKNLSFEIVDLSLFPNVAEKIGISMGGK